MAATSQTKKTAAADLVSLHRKGCLLVIARMPVANDKLTLDNIARSSWAFTL
jgi:hypothetical protein